MRRNYFNRLVLAVVMSGVATWSACEKTNTAATSAASESGGKVPVTTKSEDARKEFLQGRELSEKLLAQDSVQHFDRAIALDPEFASAELARANAAGTAKEFFEHLNKAVALADKASEGERLLILANQAGANGEAVKQKEYLEKLVAAYPNDERAHFNLGAFEFGQQDYSQAIEHLKKAPELAPNYSPAYNMLGYAYRQAGDYANAEQAFRKYIELIPNDPNPYDSHAELLLKMGKFDESIAQYRKALMIDPHFVPSHFGIAAALLYLGKPADATAELQKMADQARNDGELRTALFGMVGALLTFRGRGKAIAICLAGFALVLAWWLTLKPSNDRAWQPDVAQTAWAEIDGDHVTIHNVRNCDYRTEGDYTPHWETRSYDLAQIRGMDIFLTYWGSPWIAHPIVSFQFGDNDYIAMSIETRKEVGEQYSAIRGFFRYYELIYTVSDERDVVRLRTNYRKGEETYLFHTRATPEHAVVACGVAE